MNNLRAFKGKNLGGLLVYILKKEIRTLGIDIVQGHMLERNSRGQASHR